MTVRLHKLATLTPLALLLGCGAESDQIVYGIQTHSFANSEWSEPVNLGSVVNSTAADNNPTLSPDGLSLYFASDRPGGLGGTDIWVAQRASRESPWEAPVNLGAPISTSSADGAPALSVDGHLLFYHSARSGGQGGIDIWMARRADPKDDFGWEDPVNLGPDVNTPGDEQGPAYVASDALYFNRGSLILNGADLFRAEVGRDGRTKRPALPVTGLNDPAFNDAAPSVRTDGREMLFWSTRGGGFGAADIWVSARRSVHDAWSPPENLGGPPLNTPSAELQPDLSPDGRTLLFTSSRLGGSGGNDIWMSTRTPSGH